MGDHIVMYISGDRDYALDLKREALEARMTLKAYVRHLIDLGRKAADRQQQEEAAVLSNLAPPPSIKPKVPVIHSRPPQFSRGQKSPFTPVPPPPDEDVHYEPDENA